MRVRCGADNTRNAPPRGVMEMKLVEGLKYQGDEFVVGK
jgi:hypothetical protein